MWQDKPSSMSPFPEQDAALHKTSCTLSCFGDEEKSIYVCLFVSYFLMMTASHMRWELEACRLVLGWTLLFMKPTCMLFILKSCTYSHPLLASFSVDMILCSVNVNTTFSLMGCILGIWDVDRSSSSCNFRTAGWLWPCSNAVFDKSHTKLSYTIPDMASVVWCSCGRWVSGRVIELEKSIFVYLMTGAVCFAILLL